MGRKFLALVCLTALVFALMLPSAVGAEYDGIYCVAVNDTVLGNLLTPENMPFPSGGYLYVPISVLNDNAVLEVYSINNIAKNGTVMVFARQKVLIFNVSAGTCTDNADNQYSARIISLDGRLFIPISFVCSFFGLTYSYLGSETPGGVVPLLRISNGMRVLSDVQFASAASYRVDELVTNYLRSLTPEPSPPPPTQSATSPPPSPPPATTDGPVDHSDVPVYLAFVVAGETGGLHEILNTLAARKISALFLFRPDELAAQGGDVRRVLGHGHSVGLLLEGDAQAGFEAGNALLAHIARVETRFVALETDSASDDGWVVWSENVNGISTTGSTSARVNAILDAVAARRAPVRIALGCDAQAASVTNYLLRDLFDARYDLRVVTEGSLLP